MRVAALEARSHHTGEDLHDALLNHQRELLLASSERMRELLAAEDLRIVPAVIDDTTGAIRWRHRRIAELPIAPVK